MDVVDARAARVVGDARHRLGEEFRNLLLMAGLTGLTVWIAVAGVAGVPPVVWWVLAGVMAGEAVSAFLATVRAGRELRRLRGCSVCQTAAADEADAFTLGRRCAWRGHTPRPAGLDSGQVG